MARHIFSRQRLFEPGQVQAFKGSSAAQHLRPVKALVGVGHDFKSRPHRLPHGRQARHVFAHVRAADLDLGALEALGLRGQRLLDQLTGAQVQPAAFGGVDRHAGLRAAQQLPQGQSKVAGTPVPQGCVHASQGQAGDGANGRGVGVEKKIFPDRLNMQRVAPDQPRRQVIAQQSQYR